MSYTLNQKTDICKTTFAFLEVNVNCLCKGELRCKFGQCLCHCRSLKKVKFSTDQFRPSLGSGCCSIVTMLEKPQNCPQNWLLLHCLQKGPYFKDLVLNKDLFGILGPYWVLIYISGSLFSLFWFHSRKECQSSLIFAGIGSGLHSWQILIFTYAYALIITSSFWVLILAAWGPYWVLISQKNGSLLGP